LRPNSTLEQRTSGEKVQEQKQQADVQNLKHNPVDKQHRRLEADYATLKKQYNASQKQVEHLGEQLENADVASYLYKTRAEQKNATGK
jgi:hypothetical protein